jgi:hypothetical protein
MQPLEFFGRNLPSLQIQVQVDVRWMRLHGLQSSVLLILGSMLCQQTANKVQTSTLILPVEGVGANMKGIVLGIWHDMTP